MDIIYTDDNGNTYEVSFEYDPDRFGEEDPSQSGWHYIIIDSITDCDKNDVEFSEDELYDLRKHIWKEYKNEF